MTVADVIAARAEWRASRKGAARTAAFERYQDAQRAALWGLEARGIGSGPLLVAIYDAQRAEHAAGRRQLQLFAGD